MKASQQMDIIDQLNRLQTMDRKRDSLQKKLDEIPVKLKRFTDAIASLEASVAEHEIQARSARAESDRAELEVEAKEEEREKYKRHMNAPKLTNREYEVLQEALAGVIADIRSNDDKAIKALQAADELETKCAAIKTELEKTVAEYTAAREQLEASLAGVKAELAERDAERAEFVAGPLGGMEEFKTYERVRRKHPDAMAILEGVNRDTQSLGSDIHCSACYMACTANDAVQVLGRKKLTQCKSCVRILYVP